MRTIKAASVYVAAELGVRIANHQFRSIGLSPGSTRSLDEQAQRQAEMLGCLSQPPFAHATSKAFVQRAGVMISVLSYAASVMESSGGLDDHDAGGSAISIRLPIVVC